MSLGTLDKIDRMTARLERWLPPRPKHKHTNHQDQEWDKCSRDPVYFITNYCHIYDAVESDWIQFDLWPAQRKVVRDLQKHRLNVILKARQIGVTWTVLAYGLWLMIFRPAADIGVFSKRETEAMYLLSFSRLQGMYQRLPLWIKIAARPVRVSDKRWILSNGSVARAFPTSAGDGYTFTFVIADEFDLAQDQNKMMRSVKPTIDNGGSMVQLSRVDKSRPNTEFKNTFRAAEKGKKVEKHAWNAIFLPWQVHPARNAEWYAAQKADILTRTGALDDLYEQYPASAHEALMGRTLDRRIPPAFLDQVYDEQEPLAIEKMPRTTPVIPRLEIYVLPREGRSYVAGGDPAEGNPTSDPSACTLLDVDTGEEVAAFSGQFEIATFADYVNQLCTFYNEAPVLYERNNHGHACIVWHNDHSELALLDGYDEKPGWNNNAQGKTRMYTETTERCRDSDTLIHSEATYEQLSSIEGRTLRAPEGDNDDRADSFALAMVARVMVAGAWVMS